MNRTITYNPDTHVLVPKEPAESMVHAAEDLPPPRMFGAVYRAMLAAAPEPVQAVGQQDGDKPCALRGGKCSCPTACQLNMEAAYGQSKPVFVQQGSASDLIAAGALRQLKHNDGSEGFVFAYDKAITDRVFAMLAAKSQAKGACLDDLQAIDRAMQHMGDQVNNMDAVEEGDFEIVNPGFEAIKRALAVTTSPAVDAESVRDAALEEAAKLAETVRIQTYAVSSYATQVLCARETIAEAIRALKSDKGASND